MALRPTAGAFIHRTYANMMWIHRSVEGEDFFLFFCFFCVFESCFGRFGQIAISRVCLLFHYSSLIIILYVLGLLCIE